MPYCAKKVMDTTTQETDNGVKGAPKQSWKGSLPGREHPVEQRILDRNPTTAQRKHKKQQPQ